MVQAGSKFFSLSLLPRLVGLGVLAFILWLLLSTLLMPLVSASATRAILNAPVILLTTPIDGVVSALNVKSGSAFTRGQSIALVENPRANQETLLTLRTRRLSLEQQLSSSRSQSEHDQQFYQALEKTSLEYQSAFHTRQLYTQKALRAESSAASARLQDARETVERNLELFRQGAVSGAMVASSKAQLASLQGAAESIRSQLGISSGDLNAANQQVYLDPDQLRMFDLRAQMVTLKLSLENQARNRETLEQELEQLDALIEGREHPGETDGRLRRGGLCAGHGAGVAGPPRHLGACRRHLAACHQLWGKLCDCGIPRAHGQQDRPRQRAHGADSRLVGAVEGQGGATVVQLLGHSGWHLQRAVSLCRAEFGLRGRHLCRGPQ
ncbi:MAG: hypothetical protein P0Y51_12900 [Candidatus Pseudomonas colombiensis]|nr:MAG: hypothetical protein P0Y51_12900 [Pseudomonas sp.]